jgi:hypothetical protein
MSKLYENMRRRKKPMMIKPKTQAAINQIVLDNLHQLDVTEDQRAVIAAVLLGPSLSKEARKRMKKGRPPKP